MSYCKGCGAQLPDGAVFCPSCGRNVASDSQQQSAGTNTTSQNNYSQPVYVDDKYSIMSIIGFVFAFIKPIVGLIISIIAYNQAKVDCSSRSQSFAKSGIIISAVFLGLALIAAFFVCLFVGLGILDWIYALSLM